MSERDGRQRTGAEWTRNLPVWVLVTFVVPACLLGFAGWWVLEEMSFRDGAVEATAVVVDVERRHDADQGQMYRPTFEFETETGRTVRKTRAAWTSDAVTEGSTFPVLYRPEDPQGARQVNMIATWLAPAVTGVIGLAVLIVGVGSKLGYALPGGSHADVPLHRR